MTKQHKIYEDFLSLESLADLSSFENTHKRLLKFAKSSIFKRLLKLLGYQPTIIDRFERSYRGRQETIALYLYIYSMVIHFIAYTPLTR